MARALLSDRLMMWMRLVGEGGIDAGQAWTTPEGVAFSWAGHEITVPKQLFLRFAVAFIEELENDVDERVQNAGRESLGELAQDWMEAPAALAMTYPAWADAEEAGEDGVTAHMDADSRGYVGSAVSCCFADVDQFGNIQSKDARSEFAGVTRTEGGAA